MRKLMILSALLTLAAAFAMQPPQQPSACPGFPYRWRIVPINVEIGPTLNLEQELALRQAGALIEYQTKRRFFNFVRPEAGSHYAATVNFLYDWRGKNPMEQGLTTVKWDHFEIQTGKVQINGVGFPFSTGRSAVPGRTSLESLFVHELCHLLGIIQHTDRPTSVMVPALAAGTIRTKLDPEDISALQCMYPQ